ncbi:TPA: type II secretion system minor pseudopilin GspK [Burkholderia cepacia]|uniref:type II secretion system minor pseudopilin GspK n=1 Tax=Burkholderia cepacia TaxID=292 RepID=UPI001CF1120E|nr:type II secretion system minor pseudopilin GspK [Burkholderia cepacia]MCA8357718.1 type II secretion system minor pseudopilin GspK [Burkholderia cepacia]HDR9757179.1 type II secretion system minor pseudopilin GspK [Burkholderia cepacia ATCC 25416]HDV6369503.1 type II secretion system minor pseudopilin GspK [Burkholderia cepacia]
MHRYGKERTAHARRERGIAIVTVLLVVALAATLAASVLWRQQVATRDVENQRLATQTMWIERAAVEWARATLRAQSATSNVTFAGQTWSAPVADVPLSDLLPSDALTVNAELSRAWISGSVEDAQARFNLTNLVSRTAPGKPWQSNGEGVLAYRRLLGQLSLDPALAQPTADYMLRSLRDTNGPGGWPLQLVSVDDLARIPGYDAHAVATLAPFVTILPDLTVVNANTAAEPVLVAAIPTLSASQARRLVDRRATAYFVSTGDIAEYLLPAQGGNPTLPDGSAVGVNSGYFIVHCRVHSARINARIDTLIARYGSGNFAWTSVIWVRRLTS